jgi:hypothetical protein
MAIKSIDFIGRISGQGQKKQPAAESQVEVIKKIKNKENQKKQNIKKGNSRRPAGRSQNNTQNSTAVTGRSRVRSAPKNVEIPLGERTQKINQGVKNNTKKATQTYKKNIVKSANNKKTLSRNSLNNKNKPKIYERPKLEKIENE